MVPTAHNTRSDGVGGGSASAAATGAPPPPTHWAGGAPGGPGAGGSAVFARRPQAVAPQVRRSANKWPLFFVCVADLLEAVDALSVDSFGLMMRAAAFHPNTTYKEHTPPAQCIIRVYMCCRIMQTAQDIRRAIIHNKSLGLCLYVYMGCLFRGMRVYVWHTYAQLRRMLRRVVTLSVGRPIHTVITSLMFDQKTE